MANNRSYAENERGPEDHREGELADETERPPRRGPWKDFRGQNRVFQEQIFQKWELANADQSANLSQSVSRATRSPRSNRGHREPDSGDADTC